MDKKTNPVLLVPYHEGLGKLNPKTTSINTCNCASYFVHWNQGFMNE